MKINIEGLAPNLREKCIPVIEALPGLEARYLPELSTETIRMVFEVKDGDMDQAVGMMTMAMFRTFSPAMVFRVIEHGVLYKQ